MRGGGAWTNGYAARHSPPKWEGHLSIQSTALPPHLRFLLFSDEDPSSLTLCWCRDLPLKRLSSRIRTSCSDQLAESVIPCGYLVGSKKALLEEQISAQHCCKCHAVIVRCAGIPCTLMTLTLSVCHAWGNDPKWRCAQRGWILALRVFQSCLSALAVSFLFREWLHPSRPPIFFLPGICEKKNGVQRIWAAGDKRAHVGSMPACLAVIEGAHARHNATPSRSTKDPGPRSPWIRRLWSARQKEEGPESHYRRTTPQAASNVPLTTLLNAGCRGKCVFGSS